MHMFIMLKYHDELRDSGEAQWLSAGLATMRAWIPDSGVAQWLSAGLATVRALVTA